MNATLVGTKVGRFRVDRELGRGGMGAVYAAFDERLEREVALKVLLAKDADDEEKRRFIREARLAAKLSHPNIASIYEVDEIDGRIVIIMELLEGLPLRKVLATKRLDLDEAVSIAKDVARALARAHASGIVHRDIKPENVFVTEPAPGALHAKVLDFGLARQKDPKAGDGGETTMSQTWGTPGYMSPEQATREPVDARTDVFAFGTLFYEMVAGIRAFRAANELALLQAVLRSEPRSLSQIVPDLSPTVEGIVVRCMKKDPAERFTDGKELSAALESFARPTPTGSFRALDPSRISSPALPPISSPNMNIGESTPSNASVTATKHPPSTLPIDLRDPETKKRAILVAAVVVALLLVVILAVAFSGPATPKPTAAAPPPPATAFTAEPVVVPPPPTTSAEPVEVDEPPSGASSATTATATATTPRPARTGTAGKSKPADCKTPFIVDSKGVKIPKMHCL